MDSERLQISEQETTLVELKPEQIEALLGAGLKPDDISAETFQQTVEDLDRQ